jgi:hypothetical protein
LPHAVLATASRLERNGNFNDETETQEMTAESLSLARAQTMKLKTVETFFNRLEKIPTKNKISETPGNIFNLDKKLYTFK